VTGPGNNQPWGPSKLSPALSRAAVKIYSKGLNSSLNILYLMGHPRPGYSWIEFGDLDVV